MNENLLDLKYLNRNGDSMRGPLALAGEPVLDAHAANKRYVDTVLANLGIQSLRRDGTLPMTGPLVLSGAPTLANHAANMAYVDAHLALIAQLVRIDGTTPMTGPLTLPGAPTLPNHAATMAYVDAQDAVVPGLYERDYVDPWVLAGVAGAQRYTINSPVLAVYIDGTLCYINISQAIDLSTAAVWDALAPDYTVAANRAGVDFYIYACIPPAGDIVQTVVSDNPVVPVGYAVNNSRRIGGFHCVCVAVGAIGGHPLTGFLAGDVLPDSIWDYKHRPMCEPEGMVYSHAADLWVDIYLASGVGAATASVYNAAISDTRNWMDFVDDGAAVFKRLLNDPEFQMIALGSNEETSIAGGADPVNTGGHSDTVAQRMISNIGCEDCCGCSWQWLTDQWFGYGDGDHIHTNTITHKGVPTGSVVQKDQAENLLNGNLGSAADETTDTSNVDPAPAWAWLNLPGVRGSLYRQGTEGDRKLIAGGLWNTGANSGSRARNRLPRQSAGGTTSARFASDPL